MDYGPISLCNVLYKMVAKAFANQFRVVLNKIISKTQSAFIPGRLISDNDIVGFECMHALKRRKKGQKWSMEIKLDMSKAYDRVEWNFISERLSRLFFKVQQRKDLAGFRCSRREPKITHLFFTDDSMIFTKASEKDCRSLKCILDCYAEASRQVVNFQKSTICVTMRVSRGRAENLAGILSVCMVECHEQLKLDRQVHLCGKALFGVKNCLRKARDKELVRDSLIWHFDKMGIFSVKSAYHLRCSASVSLLSFGSGLVASESRWKYLWHLMLHAKIKQSWSPLDQGIYKINSDAAIDVNRIRIGTGDIIRDYRGLVMTSCTQMSPVNFSHHMAEALAILCGLRLAANSCL
ncbi:hypothetical protein Ddye_026393 [Dipteronia dyeriana]|uniref:Reverse transcriptase n=1 Tax=Dipteronia dyeriana TaxID=168575 RepID=A0AAD9WQF4_9ROSI|nr:hypothetical protein Ddye_026393 [Dipteronia dyeriana]